MSKQTAPPEFQNVLALHRQGNVAGALTACRNVMQMYPQHPAAFQFAGMIYCEQGRPDEGAPYLKRAVILGANSPKMRFNLAKALYEGGNIDEAREECEAVLQTDSGSVSVLCLYGDILKSSDRVQDAVTLYRRALQIEPTNLPALNNLGNALLDSGEHEEAISSFAKALQVSPGNSRFELNRGKALAAAGRHEEAVATFERVRLAEPQNPEPLALIADTLITLGGQAEALEVLQPLAELRPADATVKVNLGAALAANGRVDEAIGEFEAAIDLQADLAVAHLNLIGTLEKANRLDEMATAIDRAESNDLGQDELDVQKALLAFRSKDLDTAKSILDGLSVSDVPEIETLKAGLAGQIADLQNNIDEAFEAFSRMNNMAARQPYAQQFDGQRFVRRIDQRLTELNDYVDQSASTAMQHLSQAQPVFLVGFPRSGTTLLDAMLSGHDQITVLEEMPLIDELVEQELAGRNPFALAPDERQKIVSKYLGAVSANVTGAEQIVIDKLPFNLVEAPFIHTLFPNARFIFALRHPCDSVLSCFMQDFVPNDAMANFYELDKTAELYDTAMRLWTNSSEQLQLQTHRVNYEELVSNPESVLQNLLTFLALPWQASVLAPSRNAGNRRSIQTPSYRQVIEPVSTKSIGRWEKYRSQMESVLPLLMPWAREFGYQSN